MKKIAIIFAIIIVALLGILIFVPSKAPKNPDSNDGVSGGVIPVSAVSSDGHLEVDTFNLEANPVFSPLTVTGRVTGGGWFFEASFPVYILDADGTVLGRSFAAAQGEWMSTGTVPFSATLTFDTPHSETGTVVFHNDNPSGLPQNDKSMAIEVKFKSVTTGAGVIEGTVLLSPTCPVERIPPDPACAPKPYKTSITISKNIEESDNFKTIQTDALGKFSISLEPGEYVFHPQDSSPYPRCEEKLVDVRANQRNTIIIDCDTGIR